jgi:penicillin V acylase-like amidase (Ntn superfamily)
MSMKSLLAATISTLLVTSTLADACSRVLAVGPDKMVITGRSMDWFTPLHTNLWAFPRGIKREGAAAPNSITWTSSHGSVMAAVFDGATSDGMNDAGLVVNLLYLSDTDYGQRDPVRPGLSLSMWAQYPLDNFATVEEAVRALSAEPFQVVDLPLPGGGSPTMHLSLSDATGDSAIIEYIKGKITIHHNRDYRVMTNEPPFDQQLALNAYWTDVGGSTFLPGTDRPADRFVRASYYLGQAPTTGDRRQAVASMFSIIRNVSVPMGVEKPGRPNIAPTLWRTVSDQIHHDYYFEAVDNPNVFWVALDKLDLKEGAPIMKLDLSNGRILEGEASAAFQPAVPFTFLPAGS